MTPDRYVLVIPAPAAFLTLNGGHGNRWAKAALTKQWREAAAWSAKGARIPRMPSHVRIEALVHRTHNRGQWDVSNWLPTAKAAVDGLRDAGVLTEDSNRFVTGPDMRPGQPRNQAALTLIITLVEEPS